MTDHSALLLAHTRDVADFPKPGVLFKDLTPLFADADAFATVVSAFTDRWAGQIDAVAGIEARGFIVGPPIALALDLPFVPIRKAGKLPGSVHTRRYDLEYGTATLEIQTGALSSGQRVLIVDDVLATGGTALAAADLVGQCAAVVAGYAFLLELGMLGGRDALAHPVQSVATV